MIVEKETADNLKKIPGNVRGVVILSDKNYIQNRGGDEALVKTEKRLKELGCAFRFQDIKPMRYYPEYYSVLVILLAREIFELNQKEVFEMGKSGFKLSFMMKMLTKYFSSVRRCFEESPRYWDKHFDFGELETVECNEKDKYVIIRIKGYKFHPIMDEYHRGYFLEVASLALGETKASIELTKTVFNNDPYNEYIIHWK